MNEIKYKKELIKFLVWYNKQHNLYSFDSEQNAKDWIWEYENR